MKFGISNFETNFSNWWLRFDEKRYILFQVRYGTTKNNMLKQKLLLLVQQCGISYKIAMSGKGIYISYESTLRWLSLDLTYDIFKSTLVQVMAWCCQAINHYLSQYWPSITWLFDITGPQWLNSLRLSDTYICISNPTIIGSDNGLSPCWLQAVIWTNAGVIFIGPLGTNFSEILIEIHTFSFKKMHLEMLSGKCQPFCLNLNVLTPLLFHGTTDDNFRNQYLTSYLHTWGILLQLKDSVGVNS